jgi:hypothetical protein
LVRADRGLYYVPRQTLLGRSRPSEVSLANEKLAETSRPTGVTAANLLGLTTQVSGRPELAVYATAKPKGVGSTRVTLRKHSASEKLDHTLAAVLETLRDRGKHSELTAQETVQRLNVALLPQGTSARSLHHFVDSAQREPPRVRAMLGAMLEFFGVPETVWRPLRRSLNPLSKFTFGLFSVLPNAKEWQAK